MEVQTMLSNRTIEKILTGTFVFFTLFNAWAMPAIVIPDKPVQAELRAADELAVHLEKATGIKPQITAEKNADPEIPAFYIGATGKGSKFTITAPAYDKFIIKSAPNALILKGCNGIGTVFAVYEYLERYMGIIWCRPGYTYIPAAKEAAFPENADIVFTPGIPYRAFSIQSGDSPEAWEFLVRSRVNHGQTDWILKNYAKVMKPLGVDPLYGSPRSMHSYRFYYRKDYPYSTSADYIDMFARDEKGVPYLNKSGDFSQLCMSSKKGVDMIVKKLREFIARDREIAAAASMRPPFLYEISSTDDVKYCKCSDCRKKDEYYGSHSGATIEFMNAVASAIEKDYPEIRLQFFVYTYTFVPPKPGTIKLHKNVYARMCQQGTEFARLRAMRTLKNMKYRESSLSILHPKNDDMRAIFEAWCKIGKINVWDYQTVFRRYPEISIFEFSMPENNRYYRDNHVEVLMSEISNPGFIPFLPLRNYAAARSAYNPDLNADELIDPFLKAYYGPAAKIIKKLLLDIYRRNLEYPGSICADPDILRTDNSMEMFNFADKCFAQAMKAANDSPLALYHIRADQAYFDLVKLSKFGNTLSRDEKIAVMNRMDKNLPALYNTYGYNPKKRPWKQMLKEFEMRLAVLKAPMPESPKMFMGKKVIADINAHSFTFNPGVIIVADPQAHGGYALTLDPQDRKSAAKRKRKAKYLELGFYDHIVKNKITDTIKIPADKLPTDGKYHFYTMKNVEFAPACLIYADWTNAMKFEVSDIYPLLKNKNVDIHVSVRTSNKGICGGVDIWVDRIIITEIQL